MPPEILINQVEFEAGVLRSEKIADTSTRDRFGSLISLFAAKYL
jgi:hypothetical protein